MSNRLSKEILVAVSSRAASSSSKNGLCELEGNYKHMYDVTLPGHGNKHLQQNGWAKIKQEPESLKPKTSRWTSGVGMRLIVGPYSGCVAQHPRHKAHTWEQWGLYQAREHKLAFTGRFHSRQDIQMSTQNGKCHYNSQKILYLNFSPLITWPNRLRKAPVAL